MQRKSPLSQKVLKESKGDDDDDKWSRQLESRGCDE
jgi:hypothetical protein